MQVTTECFINDKESVRLGATKITKDHLKAKLKIEADSYYGNRAIRREVIRLYNPNSDYIDEVNSLYDEILKVYYPD